MLRALKKNEISPSKNYIFFVGNFHLAHLLKIILKNIKKPDTIFVFAHSHIGGICKVILNILAKKYCLRQFSFQAFPIEYREKADKFAFSYIDLFHESLLKASNYPDSYLFKIYETNDVEFAFKKQIILELKIVKYFELIQSSFIQNNINIEVTFNQKISELLNQANYSHLSIVLYRGRLSRIVTKIGYLLKIFALPLFLYFKSILLRKKYGSVRNPDLLIHIFNSDWGIWQSNLQPSVDWPIKSGATKRGNALFVSERELSLSYRRSFDQRKYTLEEVDQPKINIKELLAFYIHILKNFRSLSSDFKTKYIGLLDVVLKGYYIAIVWGSFLRVYSPKSFICYQGYSLGSFFRNILLDKYGCATFRYDHTFNTNFDIYVSGDQVGRPFVDNSYTNYDCEFHWGEINKLSSVNSKSLSKQHFVIKSIWTHVFKNSSDTFMDLCAKLHLHQKGTKFINCFNSSYAVNSFSGDDEHYFFLHAIHSVINAEFIENKNIVFLYKSKFPLDKYFLSSNNKLIDLVRRLRKHQRFVEIPNEVSPHVLIDHGLLTISMAYTSPSLEALIQGKKAIYFDYKCRYPGSIFREIDNFVAFSSSELQALIKYNLEVDDSDYLDKTIQFKSKYLWNDDTVIVDPISILRSENDA